MTGQHRPRGPAAANLARSAAGGGNAAPVWRMAAHCNLAGDARIEMGSRGQGSFALLTPV